MGAQVKFRYHLWPALMEELRAVHLVSCQWAPFHELQMISLLLQPYMGEALH